MAAGAPKRILILGATSAIAEACARLWANDGAQLYLIARNLEKLSLVAADLTIRGAAVQQARLDVDQLEQHGAAVDAAFRGLERVDVVLVAHGVLPDQPLCEESVAAMLDAMRTNAVSVASLLTLIANKMQAQGSGGVIAVIGSVAGDRGRNSNYVYGSAKALVATFAEGLAGRLHRHGVAVTVIKPGYVDTPMTAAFKKGLLWATPHTVATIIYRRVAAARSGIYYAPRFWRFVMTLVRCIPARVFYRLNI
jgi:decaprenylphospho-beta-D-erythro-pentofuranosid-2-ulose 2-reductase